MPQDINKILIITGARIGDQLMVTPFLRALRMSLPESRISVATGLPALSVLKNNPRIDELIIIDKGIVKKIILRGEFDLAIDLFCERDTAYLSLISGAKKRIGFKNIGDSAANTRPYTLVPDSRNRRELSFIDSYLLFARKIGLKLQGRKTELFLTDEECRKAREIFKRKGLNEKDFIVGIFASGSRRKILWQPEKFGLLADNIVDEFNAKAVFTGMGLVSMNKISLIIIKAS